MCHCNLSSDLELTAPFVMVHGGNTAVEDLPDAVVNTAS